jgi:hypothetical protein
MSFVLFVFVCAVGRSWEELYRAGFQLLFDGQEPKMKLSAQQIYSVVAFKHTEGRAGTHDLPSRVHFHRFGIVMRLAMY